jgi:hypothetical protein
MRLVWRCLCIDLDISSSERMVLITSDSRFYIRFHMEMELSKLENVNMCW